MEFYKIDNKLLNTLNINDNDTTYVLEKDDIVIGYGIITKENKNKIEIFIKEEYRSNGYGKYLFGKMLEELKKDNYKKIELTFKRDNYRIKNIIVYYGGLQLRTGLKEETYMIPISK